MGYFTLFDYTIVCKIDDDQNIKNQQWGTQYISILNNIFSGKHIGQILMWISGAWQFRFGHMKVMQDQKIVLDKGISGVRSGVNWEYSWDGSVGFGRRGRIDGTKTLTLFTRCFVQSMAQQLPLGVSS